MASGAEKVDFPLPVSQYESTAWSPLGITRRQSILTMNKFGQWKEQIPYPLHGGDRIAFSREKVSERVEKASQLRLGV